MPLTTYHWGTYEIVTKDGALTALRPFAEDPDPSRIGPSLVDLLDHPARIKRPAVRRSWLDHGPGSNPKARGCEPFVEVGWDEAETLVAAELDRVRSQFGNSAIYAGSY
ncbi:MAG: molybdopterin-dependent oxidoreductase, partial [Alphaproteobacteria bacterium]|nr:molybdopterin-dependent oxidoreductase [Alphaproteobacteria bacterium]